MHVIMPWGGAGRLTTGLRVLLGLGVKRCWALKNGILFRHTVRANKWKIIQKFHEPETTKINYLQSWRKIPPMSKFKAVQNAQTPTIVVCNQQRRRAADKLIKYRQYSHIVDTVIVSV